MPNWRFSMCSHGALVRPDGSVQFRLWAPACDRIDLQLVDRNTTLTLGRSPVGWHELITDKARAGNCYFFVLPDGTRVPDPASSFQPEDVHGPSEVVDYSTWAYNHAWKGRPWEEAVIYELHVGTFTPEGTFRSAIGRLDHLKSLGITAIELMPIGDFPGTRNWGYDGVLPYAPDSSYGRPADLKALVDAAHARGMMMLLDVVYNHFGPDGNYLGLYAPQFFTERHHTAWGKAINFDGAPSRPVRDFFIENALHWVQRYKFDGLRFDAVHAIVDESPRHILSEIADRVRAAAPDRHVHLILENEGNEAHWLERKFTAQWNDDVHHVLHTAATGEGYGYYAEYLKDSEKLGRALAEGFAFQGEIMHYRGSTRGASSAHLPPRAFVAFLQNHDQVGNRAFGERISTLASHEAMRAAAAVYLLLPQIPMLFMGEEWCAETPFPFFCDFEPWLGEKVREGRREEFSRFPAFRDPALRELIPDPQAPETFSSAQLRWDDLQDTTGQASLDWYRRILEVRRSSIIPMLKSIRHGARYQVLGENAVLVQWTTQCGALTLAANLSGEPSHGFPQLDGETIWREGIIENQGSCLCPWSVLWSRKNRNAAICRT